MLLALALAAVLSALGSAADAAERATGTVIGEARLHPRGELVRQRGFARLVLYPRHAEVDLDLRHTSAPVDTAFVVWLISAPDRAFIGGAFRNQFLRRFDASTVVPGSPRVSRRHTKRAHRLVITRMPAKRFKRLAEKARARGWRKAMPVKGSRWLNGGVAPCEGGVCPGG